MTVRELIEQVELACRGDRDMLVSFNESVVTPTIESKPTMATRYGGISRSRVNIDLPQGAYTVRGDD